MNGQILTWDLGNVTEGNQISIDLVVGTDPTTLPQTLNNFAQVSDLLRDTDVAEFQTLERASTDLDVTITPDQPTHLPGTAVVYTVDWANTGNFAASNVLVKATLPSGTTFSSATNAGQLQNGEVVWSVDVLGSGESGQASFTVDVPATAASGTRLNNTVGIDADQGLHDSDDAVVDIYDGPPPFEFETVMPVPIGGRWLWLLAGLMAGWVLLRGRPQLA